MMIAFRQPGVDDGAALQSALDTCAAMGGGVVLAPAGRWIIKQPLGVRLPSNVQLTGEGPSTLLVRTGACQVVLDASGAQNVSVTNLSIELADTATENFEAGARFENCQNVLVKNCLIRSSRRPDKDDTIHAVLATRCTDFTVESLVTRGCQIKVGNGGGKRLRVRNIRAYDSFNMAVSAVVMRDGDVLEDVVIEDVSVTGYRDTAIFVGSDDGRISRGTIRDLTVRNCRIEGPTHINAGGVCYRLGLENDNVRFENIALRLSYDDGAAPQNSMGIQITNADDRNGSATNFALSSIHQTGRARSGIEIRGGVTGLSVDRCNTQAGIDLRTIGGSLKKVSLRRVEGPVREEVRPPYVIEYAKELA